MGRKSRPRRMSSILGTLGDRDCFATTEEWLAYQDALSRLKMRALEQQMDGETIRPAQSRRHIAARKGR